jgi:hypothetical protein
VCNKLSGILFGYVNKMSISKDSVLWYQRSQCLADVWNVRFSFRTHKIKVHRTYIHTYTHTHTHTHTWIGCQCVISVSEINPQLIFTGRSRNWKTLVTFTAIFSKSYSYLSTEEIYKPTHNWNHSVQYPVWLIYYVLILATSVRQFHW